MNNHDIGFYNEVIFEDKYEIGNLDSEFVKKISEYKEEIYHLDDPMKHFIEER